MEIQQVISAETARQQMDDEKKRGKKEETGRAILPNPVR